MTDLYQYPWDEAPPEAMWAATDEDGTACWYENEPKISVTVPIWFCDLHAPLIAKIPGKWPTEHWKDSVRRRPHPHDTALRTATADAIRNMRESLAHWEWPEERLKIVEVFIENAVWRGAVATLDYRHDAIIEKTKGEKDD